MGRRATGNVDVRETCIRVRFTVEGRRCVETLDLAPSAANVKATEKLLAQIQVAIAAGVYRREDYFGSATKPQHAQTLEEYAQDWLKTVIAEKSTLRSYRTALSATWYPTLGKKLLGQIRFSDIKIAIAERVSPLSKAEQLEAHKERTRLIEVARKAGHKDPEAWAAKKLTIRKPVSGKTINNHLIVLRSIFETAVEDGLLPASPVDKIKNLKHQVPEPDPLDVEEKDLVLAHMRERYDEQVWNYYDFAFHSGLRPSEQIVLRWTDVDWRRRTAKIHRARVDWEEKDTKTKNIRVIDLNDRVYAALQRQKAHTFMKRPDGEVFENPLTRCPWPDEQRQRRLYWTPALRALGLRHRDAYQTRHTFATTLLMGGINPAYIARQLGHASLAMVFKVYARWIDGADKGAEAAKANNVFGRADEAAPAGSESAAG